MHLPQYISRVGFGFQNWSEGSAFCVQTAMSVSFCFRTCCFQMCPASWSFVLNSACHVCEHSCSELVPPVGTLTQYWVDFVPHRGFSSEELQVLPVEISRASRPSCTPCDLLRTMRGLRTQRVPSTEHPQSAVLPHSNPNSCLSMFSFLWSETSLWTQEYVLKYFLERKNKSVKFTVRKLLQSLLHPCLPNLAFPRTAEMWHFNGSGLANGDKGCFAVDCTVLFFLVYTKFNSCPNTLWHETECAQSCPSV